MYCIITQNKIDVLNAGFVISNFNIYSGEMF